MQTINGAMRLLFLPLLGFLLAACGSSSSVRSDRAQETMVLGWADRSFFQEPAFRAFQERYDTVEVNQDFIELIQQVQPGIEVLVFFGTWCSDSRRDLPGFYKISDMAGIGADRIRLYGLDRSKKSPDGLTERYSIELVPTFIFQKEGQEIGRIVEQPKMSLEADILTILAGAASR